MRQIYSKISLSLSQPTENVEHQPQQTNALLSSALAYTEFDLNLVEAMSSTKKSVCWSVALASRRSAWCWKKWRGKSAARVFYIHQLLRDDDDKIASVLVRLAAEMFIFHCHIYIA
jgi:hypothetical protein